MVVSVVVDAASKASPARAQEKTVKLIHDAKEVGSLSRDCNVVHDDDDVFTVSIRCGLIDVALLMYF